MPAEVTTEARIDWQAFQDAAPEVVTAMRAIGAAVHHSGLERDLLELVKLRASQLNGCAFCLQFHLNDARKLGVRGEKLDLLAAWRDAGIYSERESAALAWTECVTLQNQHHVDDQAFAEVSRHFSEREITFLTIAIGHINFWNRVAAPFRFTPPIPRSAA
ncbi:carboxymuconolactone decarboxylase family protein [Occallatibacter riparius]|uniref:Carboxymuconolactone decarboxylase family protein n=1 Tax=Occallatibacter riparius TaxID=1002689 RepID=A0A9J7BQL8_9BACT|nr:carboxymuconolactone decarboxylase family protein [Occallatibacter riparius]UWZ83389.1 carboxymuconolactone decarboxylase family protein [Occallatibacter riparius]